MFSLHFTRDSFVRSTKTMAHCSPLGEVGAANMAEAENVGEKAFVMVVVPTIDGDEIPMTSGNKGRALSEGGIYDSTDGKASDNENSRTYNFGASTITLGHIKEMAEKGYFADGKTWVLRVETVLEPNDDEVVVYEDFFFAGLHMPLHSALAGILLKFQAQLYQLTPNAIA
jgi:hypothetical protein